MPVWPCSQRVTILPPRDCLLIMPPVRAACVVRRDQRQPLPLWCWAPGCPRRNVEGGAAVAAGTAFSLHCLKLLFKVRFTVSHSVAEGGIPPCTPFSDPSGSHTAHLGASEAPVHQGRRVWMPYPADTWDFLRQGLCCCTETRNSPCEKNSLKVTFYFILLSDETARSRSHVPT